MTNKFKKLQLEALDKKIKKVRFEARPKKGWVRTIRSSMAIPLPFVAAKLGVSPQSIFQTEQSEIDETISLKTLRRLAEALDCHLHYAIVPRQKSLKKMIEKRAATKAKTLVNEVDKTMSLENQRVKNSKKSVKLLAKELAGSFNVRLWS